MGNDYTYEERLLILKCIIKMKAYNKLRGVAVWKECENSFKNRSWQSLKEHFRRRVILNIDTFAIDAEEKEKIRQGWLNSASKRQQKTTTSTFKNTFSDEECVISSDDSTTQERPTRTRRKRSKSTAKRRSSSQEKKKAEKYKRVQLFDTSSGSSIELQGKFQIVAESAERDDESSVSVTPDEVVFNISNNNDETNLDETTPAPISTQTDPAVEFTTVEDNNLLRYMKNNDIFLARKDQEKIYECFLEIYPECNKTAKVAKDRFINHILPNLDKYDIPKNDKISMYTIAKLPIPEAWKLGTETEELNSDSETQNPEVTPTKSQNKQNTDNDITPSITQTDNETTADISIISNTSTSPELEISHQETPNKTAESGVDEIVISDSNSDSCTEETSKKTDNIISYVYCVFYVKDQSHILVAFEDERKEKILKAISNKFHLDLQYIHIINFDMYILVEQIKLLKKCIVQQFSDFISQNLESPITVSVNDLVNPLEIIFASLDLNYNEQSSPQSRKSPKKNKVINKKNVENSQKSPQKTQTSQKSSQSGTKNVICSQIIQQKSPQKDGQSSQTITRTQRSQPSTKLGQTDVCYQKPSQSIKTKTPLVSKLICTNLDIDPENTPVSPGCLQFINVQEPDQCDKSQKFVVKIPPSPKTIALDIKKYQPKNKFIPKIVKEVVQTDSCTQKPTPKTKKTPLKIISSSTLKTSQRTRTNPDIELEDIQISQKCSQILKKALQTDSCSQKSTPQTKKTTPPKEKEISLRTSQRASTETEPEYIQSRSNSPKIIVQTNPCSQKSSPKTEKITPPKQSNLQTSQSTRTNSEPEPDIESEHNYSSAKKIKLEIKEEPQSEDQIYLTLNGETVWPQLSSGSQEQLPEPQTISDQNPNVSPASQYLDSTQSSNLINIREAVSNMAVDMNESDCENFVTPDAN